VFHTLDGGVAGIYVGVEDSSHGEPLEEKIVIRERRSVIIICICPDK
jgi:hypothetical protein